MTALFTSPLDGASGMLCAYVHGAPAGFSVLHLAGSRLELAVLFSAGATLMLCSALVRKAARMRRPLAVPRGAAPSAQRQVSLAEGAE